MAIAKKRALQLIQTALDQISDLKQAGKETPEFTTWRRDTRVALENIFDENAHQVAEFTRIKYRPRMFVAGGSNDQIGRSFIGGIDRAQATLDSIKNEIDNYWEDDSSDEGASGQVPSPSTNGEMQTPINGKVFVVHGRNDSVRATVTSFLSRIGLDPIVLQDQPNEGRTIIEKFEDYSDVGFAVVLLTPDDIGGLNDSDLNPRPRQNVVLEWGFFLGKLGRDRVAALLQDEIEFPNDYSGVVYIEIDDNEGWNTRLFRELNNAGMPVDHNKL